MANSSQDDTITIYVNNDFFDDKIEINVEKLKLKIDTPKEGYIKYTVSDGKLILDKLNFSSATATLTENKIFSPHPVSVRGGYSGKKGMKKGMKKGGALTLIKKIIFLFKKNTVAPQPQPEPQPPPLMNIIEDECLKEINNLFSKEFLRGTDVAFTDTPINRERIKNQHGKLQIQIQELKKNIDLINNNNKGIVNNTNITNILNILTNLEDNLGKIQKEQSFITTMSYFDVDYFLLKNINTNFAFLYYLNNKEINLDFVMDFLRKKFTITTDKIQELKFKILKQALFKVLIDYSIVDKYFGKLNESPDGYVILYILNDPINNNKNKDYLALAYRELKNYNPSNYGYLKDIVMFYLEKALKQNTTTSDINEKLKLLLKCEDKDLQYTIFSIIKYIFTYRTITKENEFSITSQPYATRGDEAEVFYSLEDFLYYYEESEIVQDEGEDAIHDDNYQQENSAIRQINITTFTQSQLKFILKYLGNIKLLQCLDIINNYETFIGNKNGKKPTQNEIRITTEKFRDRLFQYIAFPDYYNISEHYESADLPKDMMTSIKDIITDTIESSSVITDTTESSSVMHGGQRKYLPELYKCNDNRYRKVFLIKGHGNTRFVMSKNKIIKASTILPIKKSQVKKK